MQKTRMLIYFLIALIFVISIFKIVLFFQTKKLPTEIKGIKTIITIIPTVLPSFTPAPIATPSPTLAPTSSVTPIPTLAPIIILPKDLDDLFTKYSDQYSVDKELLKRIADCESGLNPNTATNLYAGLFQFAEPIWIQTRTLLGLDPDVGLRFSPEEAVKTAAFMVSQGHLGIWPNCSK